MLNIETIYHSYRVGSSIPLSKDQMGVLVQHLKMTPSTTDTALGGRYKSISVNLTNYGPVTIKKYWRGGLIRHLNRDTHVRWGPTRPQAEFDMLNRVRKVGIKAPEPLAYVIRGGPLYQGWLVMQQIENAHTLVELCKLDPAGARAMMDRIGHQVSLLIDNQIYHTDLHPGNVLIDADGACYIIDFDKTRIDIHNRETLRCRYQQRWQRAIIKYRLPQWLETVMAPVC